MHFFFTQTAFLFTTLFLLHSLEYREKHNSIQLPYKDHRNITIIKLDEFLFSGE